MTATMMDILFNGVGWTDIALTLNRIAVGVFFMLSGYHKLFNGAAPASPSGSLPRSPRLAYL